MARKVKESDLIAASNTTPTMSSSQDSAGGKIVTTLIVLVIVIIWLAIFAVLIKLDVGNFGSEVLYPVLKDVPVVNMILPEPIGAKDDDEIQYDNLAEANARIQELEKKLAMSNNADSANGTEIEELQAEINRLKKFEEDQKAFSERVKVFDENVVYSDKAPDTEEYKKYYEGIEPDNAEQIYREVCKAYEYSQEIKNQADMYGKMEPANAAAVLSEMTNDLDLVAKILGSMQTSKRAEIMNNMAPTVAAQITTKMASIKKQY